MKKMSIDSIPSNTFFSQPVFLDSGFILLSPDTPFTEEMKKLLRAWDFPAVETDGNPSSTPPAIAGQGEFGGGAVLDKDIKEKERLSDAQTFYRDFLRGAKEIFLRFASTSDIDSTIVTDRVKSAIEAIKNNRSYVLRLSRFTDVEENFTASHAVRSTLLTIDIGNYLKLPPHKLIELGIACLLHEVGMLKIPQSVFMADRQLSVQEKKVVMAHTVLGYKFLKAKGFPESVALASMEHHERMDGSGYPRRLAGGQISVYSRIIAVACSYEAQTSARPHRPERDGHEILVRLLKDGAAQYDDKILKSLVMCLSFFPLGSYVLLSDSSKGQVVDTVPEIPRFPIVKLLVSDGNAPLVDQVVIQTSADKLHIERILTPDEAKEVEKLVAG